MYAVVIVAREGRLKSVAKKERSEEVMREKKEKERKKAENQV